MISVQGLTSFLFTDNTPYAMTHNNHYRQVLILCLVTAPLLQLCSDVLWLTGYSKTVMTLIREVSMILFVPTGFWLAYQIGKKAPKTAILCGGLFMTGCMGFAALMPLYRLPDYVPDTIRSQFDIDHILYATDFAPTIFLFTLCFPLSLLVIGISSFVLGTFSKMVSAWIAISGILFWIGNALHIAFFLIVGDAWLCFTYALLALILKKPRLEHRQVLADVKS